MNHSWDDRIGRTENLMESCPYSRSALSFYREVLLFQKDLYNSLLREVDSHQDQKPDRLSPPGSTPLESSLLSRFFSPFLSLISRVGTQELSQLSNRFLTSSGQKEWERLLKSYWSRDLDRQDFQKDSTQLFFPKAFLQPYAELLAHELQQRSRKDGMDWQPQQGAEATCPSCGRLPQVGVLTTEGEGASRSLICSLCGTEWRYKRISCPCCGEEEFSKLSYHRASDFPHVRVDVCDGCKRYMKSIDLTVDGRAVPAVDEVATLPLDVWAVEQGYRKIELNLVGM